MKKTLKKYSPLFFAPLFTALTILLVFARRSLYPFGSRTAAWCDMNQQVVPLLCQFKDILEGRSGALLSFKNACGMNLWGVIFFFIASPFSLLVKFVEKEDMLVFMNILIVLKLSLSAFTSSLYFVKAPEHKKLSPAFAGLLGFVYATSGYAMLFYQNIIWLDMMYLFPILVLSLRRMEKKSAVMYAVTLAVMMTVNYYIGYMVVIFLLLYVGVFCLVRFRSRANPKETFAFCTRFVFGSALAALMSAFVWLPSFIQYLGSGRKTSLFDDLRKSDLVTDYDTVLPVIMCSAVLLFFTAVFLFCRQKRSDYQKIWITLSAFLTLPLFIEPVNKMWHTGSYMSFPARYAFMTIFSYMILAAFALEKEIKPCDNVKKYVFSGTVSAVVIVLCAVSSSKFISKSLNTLSDYTKSLGGSEGSFKGLVRILIVGLITAAVIWFFYKKGRLMKSVFTVFVCVLVFIEAVGNVRIYMTTAGERNEATNALQRQVFGLSDKISDDSFYRVKTSKKLFDYNMIGAFGYNSLGHYTSLTNEDYMFAMKRMGYTSVWMEVGTCGGTELTDAMLSVGYEINRVKNSDTIWSCKGYCIGPLENKLPMGSIVNDENEAIPPTLSRTQVQQYLAGSVFGDSEIVSEYLPTDGLLERTPSGFVTKEDDLYIYRIKVKGRQTLYFDCFDKLSNDLSEPIYNSFSVSANGRTVSSSYPYAKENGVLKLGTFKDQTVTVAVSALKDSVCSSFGVFGVDLDRLKTACENMQGLGLKEKPNGLSADVDTDGGTVMLTVPYDEGLTVKVNGKKVETRRIYSAFTAFELEKGSAKVEVGFCPKGLKTGVVMTVLGIVLLCVYAVLKKKENKTLGTLCAAVSAVGACAAVVCVYVLPVVLNVVFWLGNT